MSLREGKSVDGLLWRCCAVPTETFEREPEVVALLLSVPYLDGAVVFWRERGVTAVLAPVVVRWVAVPTEVAGLPV